MYRNQTRYEQRVLDAQEDRDQLLENLYELIVNGHGLDNYKMRKIAKALRDFALEEDVPLEEEPRTFGIYGNMTWKEAQVDAMINPDKYKDKPVW